MNRQFIFEVMLPLATIAALTAYGMFSADWGVTVIAACVGTAFLAANAYALKQLTDGTDAKSDAQPAAPAVPTIQLPPTIVAHLQARRYSKNDWTDDEFAWMVSLIVANFTITAPTVERDSRS